MEELRVYQMACELADELWNQVVAWDAFAKRIVGEQLLRSLDSVAANLIEGDGRHSAADALNFFRYSRASARESRHWIKCAARRKLISARDAADFDARLVLVAKSINALITYRTQKTAVSSVKEDSVEYNPGIPDPVFIQPNP